MKLSRISVKTIVTALIFILFYFQLWRPTRTYLTQKLVRPAVATMSSASGSTFELYATSTPVTFNIVAIDDSPINSNKAALNSVPGSYMFKGFGGIFFLMLGFTLLLFGHYRACLYLFLFHQAATLVLFLFITAAVFVHHTFLNIAQLTQFYLIPVASIMFIVQLVQKEQ